MMQTTKGGTVSVLQTKTYHKTWIMLDSSLINYVLWNIKQTDKYCIYKGLKKEGEKKNHKIF